MKFEHFSVLLDECIEGLNIHSDGVYVDGTAGGAGHSIEIAKKLQNGMLISADRDKEAVDTISERLKSFDFSTVIHKNFKDVPNYIKDIGVLGVDGVLLDLGVSSYQLDNPDRGFSYRYDAPLDMRMGQTGISAKEVVNNFSVEDISKILYNFGEEKFSFSIARNIEKERNIKDIESTFELVDIIKKSVPYKYTKGKHPAKKTFQALRIFVNNELDDISIGIDNFFDILNPKGRLVVISFHSLEDRIIKKKFNEFATGCICSKNFPICICNQNPKCIKITKKPIFPSLNELSENNRSRSAKLRIIEKV